MYAKLEIEYFKEDVLTASPEVLESANDNKESGWGSDSEPIHFN